MAKKSTTRKPSSTLTYPSPSQEPAMAKKPKITATGEVALLIPEEPLLRCALHALPKPDEKVRGGVSCGEHEVDYTIHVRGRLLVGADALVRQVNKLQPWTLVKILAGKMSDELFTKCLDEAVVAAVAGTEIAGSDEIKDRVDAALDQIAPHVTQTRKGSVRFQGKVEILDG